ncbi:MAG: NUDIX domain-containing protein [Clostridia bacterium]|nr:NUDIX domain-containing protein [Clostridia bacterium]
MELVDLFDNKRKFINKVVERYHYTPEYYSQVLHLWIMNSKGEFLIQKRSMKKKINPGIWSITGGGADSGETTLDAVYRECKEELGIDIKPDELQLIMSIKRPYVFMDIYLAKIDIAIEDIVMEESEVDEVKWATEDEIKKMIAAKEMGSSITLYHDLFFNLVAELGTNPDYKKPL